MFKKLILFILNLKKKVCNGHIIYDKSWFINLLDTNISFSKFENQTFLYTLALLH